MKTLLALLMLSTVVALGQPAQIILFRHGEKPDDPLNHHLSSRGEERARALVSLLGTNATLTGNAPIAALYATRVTKHDHSERTGETLKPLANALGLPVQTPYETGAYTSLARLILTNASYRGKTIVICWTHHNIAEFAEALGVRPKPSPWKAKTFDRLWIINPGKSTGTLKDSAQHLLSGDATQ